MSHNIGLQVRIVNHPNLFLNGKLGTIVGRDPAQFHFFGWQVWLLGERFTVIIPELCLAPVDTPLPIAWVDLFALHWMLWANRIATSIKQLLAWGWGELPCRKQPCRINAEAVKSYRLALETARGSDQKFFDGLKRENAQLTQKNAAQEIEINKLKKVQAKGSNVRSTTSL